MRKMIGCCGLDCEKCDAYTATVNNDDCLREKTAVLWSELNNAPITADMINCMGCRMEGVKTPFCDYMCEIRKCACGNGFGTCKDCKDMAKCSRLAMITDNNSEALNNLTNQ